MSLLLTSRVLRPTHVERNVNVRFNKARTLNYFRYCHIFLNGCQSAVPSARLSVLLPPIEILGVEAVRYERSHVYDTSDSKVKIHSDGR